MAPGERLTTKICAVLTLWMLVAIAFCQQASIVKEIVVRGNQRVSKEAILAAMRTKAGKTFSQDDLDRDQRSLEDLGFFSAVNVHATPADLNAYQVTVDLQEWPVIKEFRITGNSVVHSDEIIKALTMKVGDVYNLNARKTSDEAVVALYAKKGYFASIDDFNPLPESPGTINIHLLELRVGQVSTRGNVRTKDWVMRRLIKTRAGQVFSGDQWSKDLTRVHNTGWFDSVAGKSDDSAIEAGKINLIADVKEGRTGTFNVGVQLDPESSLAGLIKLQESNLYGTGKTVSLNFTQAITGGGPSVDLGYVNPFYDAKDTAFQASVYSRLVYRFGSSLLGGLAGQSPFNNSDQYYERRTGFTTGFTRPLTDQVSVGISGRVENVVTSNTGATPLNGFIQQDGDVAVLGLAGTRDRRDVNSGYLARRLSPS